MHGSTHLSLTTIKRDVSLLPSERRKKQFSSQIKGQPRSTKKIPWSACLKPVQYHPSPQATAAFIYPNHPLGHIHLPCCGQCSQQVPEAPREYGRRTSQRLIPMILGCPAYGSTILNSCLVPVTKSTHIHNGLHYKMPMSHTSVAPHHRLGHTKKYKQ